MNLDYICYIILFLLVIFCEVFYSEQKNTSYNECANNYSVVVSICLLPLIIVMNNIVADNFKYTTNFVWTKTVRKYRQINNKIPTRKTNKQ